MATQLAQVYAPGDARVWLFSPHRDLGGERPVDLIASDRMDEVLAIIDRLQSARLHLTRAGRMIPHRPFDPSLLDAIEQSVVGWSGMACRQVFARKPLVVPG